jgi:Cytochrome c554 and c-prime
MPKHFRKIRNTHYVMLSLLTAIGISTRMCTARPDNSNAATVDIYGHAFAGSVACMSCHKEIYRTHLATAHYRDSRPASAASIKGRFDSGRNRFVFNPSSAVVMEKRGNDFFQVAYVNGKESASEPFDIVIGSGKKGQTYLYYGSDGELFQLPISYSATDSSWCNSPGYYPDSIRFNRVVNAYCLECHATFAASPRGEHAEDDENRIDKSRIIYGIDCERCHGPGAEHVRYHTTHPGEREGKYILSTRTLSRQQRLDACALCHSGLQVPLKPAFTFQVGDTLGKYYAPGLQTGTGGNPEVHGNQYGLLRSSKCFLQSQLDCASCHDVHVNEVNNPKLFSQRCMTCHNEPAHNTCTIRPVAGLVLSDNCIDCHMPALASRKIVLQGSGSSATLLSGATKASPALVRTHRIAIYPESTRQFLESQYRAPDRSKTNTH